MLHSFFADEIINPVFILGCGRSGTTILGRALSQHPQVTFLNEPRHLWYAGFPETDIWTRPGKMVLTADDVTPEGARRMRQLFADEVRQSGRPLLIEKLPINNFRLTFINNIFPDSRFIHIFRNGLEVARSMVNIGQWFDRRRNGWHLISEHARHSPSTSALPELCSTEFERCLLEWRLGTEAVHTFFNTIARDRFTEIFYDDLVAKPVATLNRLLLFLGLEQSTEMEDFCREEIAQKSAKISTAALSETENIIAGDLIRYYEGKTRNADGR